MLFFIPKGMSKARDGRETHPEGLTLESRLYVTVHRTLLNDTAAYSINKYTKGGGASASASEEAGSKIFMGGRGWLTTL